MRVAKTTAFAFMTMAGLIAAHHAMAQAAYPPGADPLTGARPGNVIGSGNSLPMSNNSSNINSGDTRSLIAPRLPSPGLSDSASPRDFLVAARQALASNRTGEAQESLERAESRALAGNVLASNIDQPSQQAMVRTISAARQQLASGDKAGAIRTIDAIIARP